VVQVLEVESGKALKQWKLPKEMFGEGIESFDGKR
jgi:hypothetical protein